MSRISTGAPGACSPMTRAASAIREQHAVGDLGHRLELLRLWRADERERRERVGGEPHQRGQAGIGEAGGAGLEHRLPDARIAVDGLGHADERDALAEQARGK